MFIRVLNMEAKVLCEFELERCQHATYDESPSIIVSQERIFIILHRSCSLSDHFQRRNELTDVALLDAELRVYNLDGNLLEAFELPTKRQHRRSALASVPVPRESPFGRIRHRHSWRPRPCVPNARRRLNSHRS